MQSSITRIQIGRRVAAIRKKRSLSQEELAKMLGVSRPVVVQIESGNRGIEVKKRLLFSIDEFFIILIEK